MRATSFVDAKTKTGLDSPVMTVVAKFDEGKKEERVTFGKNGSDVYAVRIDDPGAAKIEAEKFDDAPRHWTSSRNELHRDERPVTCGFSPVARCLRCAVFRASASSRPRRPSPGCRGPDPARWRHPVRDHGRRAAEHPALERATFGIAVRSLDLDEPLYQMNARKLLLPSSAMKIVTLAGAADQPGWDYTFTTRLMAGGPIRGGTLAGDLVVIGRGRP